MFHGELTFSSDVPGEMFAPGNVSFEVDYPGSEDCDPIKALYVNVSRFHARHTTLFTRIPMDWEFNADRLPECLEVEPVKTYLEHQPSSCVSRYPDKLPKSVSIIGPKIARPLCIPPHLAESMEPFHALLDSFTGSSWTATGSPPSYTGYSKIHMVGSGSISVTFSPCAANGAAMVIIGIATSIPNRSMSINLQYTWRGPGLPEFKSGRQLLLHRLNGYQTPSATSNTSGAPSMSMYYLHDRSLELGAG